MSDVKIPFDALLDAFTFASAGQPSEHEAFLCRETGVFYFRSDYGDQEEPLPDDIDNEGRYITIPNQHDLDLGRRLALGFAEEFLPDQFGEVQDIFRRRGAYGRFKDLLERGQLIQRWYEYEANATRIALLRWCEDEGIAVIDDATRRA